MHVHHNARYSTYNRINVDSYVMFAKVQESTYNRINVDSYVMFAKVQESVV